MTVPPNVYSDFSGFQWLCNVAQQLRTSQTVSLDFSNTGFFDGNLCAVLGALFQQHELEAHVLTEHTMNPAVLRSLGMNGFLPSLGGTRFPDEFDTTIKYRHFTLAEAKKFSSYLDVELLNKELPLLPTTKKNFHTTLAEVFQNCNFHSQAASGVFSCGQHFPTKEIINYTLVDLGIGFGGSVSRRFGRPIPAKAAVGWAVVAGNSARPGQQLGGYGLSDIQDMILKNEGIFQIVSGDTFWEFRGHSSKTQGLPVPFEGTIVNLQLNVALEKHRQMDAELAKM